MRDYSDHATLTVSDCVLTANKGGTLFGGIGINNELGPAAPVERGNPRDAGEAYADRPAGFPSLMVVNCIISDNSGSGVANRSAIVTIINSSISGNFVGNSGGQFGTGGGIYTGGGKLPGNLTVINSTISGNFASLGGGGIESDFSALSVVNSTISGNSIGDPDYGDGGGIGASSGTLVNSNGYRQLGCYLWRRLRWNGGNRKYNPDRECGGEHRWQCHVARLQRQQRRCRRSSKRPGRSDQYRPAAWSVAA